MSTFQNPKRHERVELAVKTAYAHNLPPVAFSVYKHMADRAGPKGYRFFEKIPRITWWVGYSESAVKKALPVLEKHALIERDGKHIGGIIIYHLNSPAHAQSTCQGCATDTPGVYHRYPEQKLTEVNREAAPPKGAQPSSNDGVEIVEPRECEPLVGSHSRSTGRERADERPQLEEHHLEHIRDLFRSGIRRGLDIRDSLKRHFPEDNHAHEFGTISNAMDGLRRELTDEHDQGGETERETQAVEERATANVAG